MSDALEQAKTYLEKSFGEYGQTISAERAQAAALIAIAERMDTQNGHLEYLRGHLNVAASAQIAIAERMGGDGLSLETLTQVQTLIIEALCTDGGHHKQWYLEEVLVLITKPDTFETCKAAYEWKQGLAP